MPYYYGISYYTFKDCMMKDQHKSAQIHNIGSHLQQDDLEKANVSVSRIVTLSTYNSTYLKNNHKLAGMKTK